MVGEGEERRYELEIVAAVRGGRLEMGMSYGGARSSVEWMRGLAAAVEEELDAVIEHGLKKKTVEYTPSDFPLAQLDQNTLNKVFEEIDVE
jgi:non-ribosomal peptide synthase protein (TIGR01720 family)